MGMSLNRISPTQTHTTDPEPRIQYSRGTLGNIRDHMKENKPEALNLPNEIDPELAFLDKQRRAEITAPRSRL